MHVGLLTSDGCFSSGLTALIDVLSTAQAERRGVDPSIPPIRVDVTGTGRRVTTAAGLAVPVTMHPRDLPAVDVVVVPPGANTRRSSGPPQQAGRQLWTTRGSPEGRWPRRAAGQCPPAAGRRSAACRPSQPNVITDGDNSADPADVLRAACRILALLEHGRVGAARAQIPQCRGLVGTPLTAAQINAEQQAGVMKGARWIRVSAAARRAGPGCSAGPR
jgi:hypothetical protein